MSSASPPSPIDLAVQRDFVLGPLTVKPSTLEIVRAPVSNRDVEREVLEPRVMQVLVALHQGAPNVVSRDALIAQCWEGRVVGDDAINRAIGRLRRLAEADNAFAIETIPRVGYRLTASTITAKPQTAEPPATSRRALLYAGAGAGVLAAAGGAAWWLTRPAPVSVTLSTTDAKAAQFVTHGTAALRHGGVAEQGEALANFQAATQLAPQMADAWAGLALAYALSYRNGSPAKAQAMLMRSRDAQARALTLDPKNALGWYAKAALLRSNRWQEKEMIVRQGLAWHPDSIDLNQSLASRLVEVGRNRQASSLLEGIWTKLDEPFYTVTWMRIPALWSAGRLSEADQAATRGMELFPRAVGTWFSRFYLLLYTGRAREALTMIDDVDGHPIGVPDIEYPGDRLAAQALASGDKKDIDKAAAAMPAFAAMGGGFAENAVEFLSAMGCVDDAYKIAEACYFGRGIPIAATRFAETQGTYTVQGEASNWSLFKPSTRAMRRDRRFAAFVDELGLTKYWKDSGTRPDYQVYPEPA